MQSNITSPSRTSLSTKQAHPAEFYTATLPATGYVRVRVVAAVCGIAPSTVWAWTSQGRLPSPVKLSERVTAWPVGDLRAYLNDPTGWQARNASKAQEAHDE